MGPMGPCGIEELTMDYSFHGNPIWYREACSKFVVLTDREIAERY